MRDGFLAEHVGRPLLAAVPAQRRRLPAAQDRQGDVRQHLARRAGGERGRAARRSAGSRSASRWASPPATTPSRSRATPAATRLVGVGQHARRAAALPRRRPREADVLADHVHRRQRHGHAAAARADHRRSSPRPSPRPAGRRPTSSATSSSTRACRRGEFERLLRDWTHKPIWNLAEEARRGTIPANLYAAPMTRTGWCRSSGSRSTS